MDRLARGDVAVVLRLQRVRVVFQVVEHVDRLAGQVLHQAEPRLPGLGQDVQPRLLRDVLDPGLGVARNGDRELVVEAAQQVGVRPGDPVPEHAEHLALENVLGHAVEVVQRRLGAPADVEAAEHVLLGPLDDAGQFVPVVHLLEGHGLDRRAGDDQPVELLALDLVPGVIEVDQVAFRGVPRSVGTGLQQGHLDLQRGRAGETGDLGLGADLVGHQVQERDFERPDVLTNGVGFADDLHAFLLEHLAGGEIVVNLDRHGVS